MKAHTLRYLSFHVVCLMIGSLRAEARLPGVALEEAIVTITQTESTVPTRTLIREQKTFRSEGEGKKLRRNLELRFEPRVDPAITLGLAQCEADRAERAVKVAASCYAEGTEETRSFPENTRQVHAEGTANYRDNLDIRSDESFSNVRLEFSFDYELAVTALKANAFSGGGGSTASVQAIVIDQQEDKILVGSNVGTGSGNTGNAGQITLSVRGDLGPTGFRGSSRLYFSMSAFAASSATHFYTVKYAGRPSIRLSAIRVYDSTGQMIPPRRLKFDSTSGRDYRPVFSVDPFDGDATSLRGSILPAGGAPVDAATKDFFGGIDALLRPVLNQLGVGARGALSPEPAFTFTTNLVVGEDRFAIKGMFDTAGTAHFSPGATPSRRVIRKNGSPLDISLTLDRVSDPPKIIGIISDAAGVARGAVRMDLHQFTASPSAPIYYPFVPDEMLGVHTVALPAASAPNRTLTQDAYPKGAGVGRLVVKPGGHVKLTGKLADGTPWSAGGIITAGGRLFLYTPLYRAAGAFGGTITFEDAEQWDAAADGLVWMRPAQARSMTYPAGWPDGIDLKLRASRYVVPVRQAGLSVFPGLMPENPAGNLILQLSGASLPDAEANDADPLTPFIKNLNVTPKNQISVVGGDDLAVAARIQVLTGGLGGSFRLSDDLRPTTYQSVILQKSQSAAGYFLRSGESGLAEATPRPTSSSP